jgi:hypothetical protein
VGWEKCLVRSVQGGEQLDRPQRSSEPVKPRNHPPSETDDGNFGSAEPLGFRRKANVIGEGTEPVQLMNSPRS